MLQVTGSGYRSDSSWDRVFEIHKNGWEKTLQDLKAWCESQAPEQPEPRIMGLGDSYLAEAVLQRRRIS